MTLYVYNEKGKMVHQPLIFNGTTLNTANSQSPLGIEIGNSRRQWFIEVEARDLFGGGPIPCIMRRGFTIHYKAEFKDINDLKNTLLTLTKWWLL